MKMKALALSAVLLATASAQADEIRYALWAQPGEAQYEGAQEFKRVVEENSDHTVTIFPGDQLGTPREVYAQMALGSTQMLASGDPGLKEIEYLALPYLMEYPHQCTEQRFNRLYANSLAAHIANSDPRIRRVFDLWKGTDALDSPLEKNEDLKSKLSLEAQP